MPTTHTPSNVFTRSPEQVRRAVEPPLLEAATNVLATKQVLEIVAQHVNNYQQEILNRKEWTTDRAWSAPTRITNPKHAGRMSIHDYQLYNQECTKAAHAIGYRIPGGTCPQLEMREALNQAENHLLNVLEPVTGFNSSTTLIKRDPIIRGAAIKSSLKMAKNLTAYDSNAALRLTKRLLSALQQRHLN